MFVVLVYAFLVLFLHMVFWMCMGNIVSFYSKCLYGCSRCRQNWEREKNKLIERMEDIADKMCNPKRRYKSFSSNRYHTIFCFVLCVYFLFTVDSSQNNILLPFPVVVIHCLKEKSVFFHLLNAWHSRRIKDIATTKSGTVNAKNIYSICSKGNSERYLGNIHQGDLLKIIPVCHSWTCGAAHWSVTYTVHNPKIFTMCEKQQARK